MGIKFSRAVTKKFILRLISIGVLSNGLLILLGALTSHVVIRGRAIVAHDLHIDLPVIVGITLVYLASLLNRRKQAAWAVTLFVYAFYLGVSVTSLISPIMNDADLTVGTLVRAIFLPVVVIAGLTYYRYEFNVRSDIQSFTLALRTIGLLLLLTFCYGVIGFFLLDRRDFHEEISLLQGAHYTIDQFGLTTSHVLKGYSERGRVFLDSLSLVSSLSIFYALVSLFQPIKARLVGQNQGREQMQELLTEYPSTSEDFFKVWPEDKSYLFTKSGANGIAYRTERGVALSKGDIAGKSATKNTALKAFEDMCRTNDWLPAFVYTQPKFDTYYKAHGYNMQKIGEEGVIQLNHFADKVAGNKYFRHITNKFTKLGYTTEILSPPHSEQLLARTTEISASWLALPGRSERGFMMGYYSADYMQLCNLMVMKDADGVVQAFINQVPSYVSGEANYDLLRYSRDAPSNSNDFLLLGFIAYLQSGDYKRLNLGLCPLVGLSDHNGDQAIIDAAMRFMYSNGDRFYSFSGLYRFKSKYEPEWRDCMIAYKKGLRGFTRTMDALNRAMTRSVHRDS